MARGWLAGLLLAVGGAGAGASGADGFHTELSAAYPAADSVHAVEIREIRLRFSTEVQPSLSAITLMGPRGVVPVGSLEPVPGSGATEIRVGLAEPLGPGSYTVEWRTAGPDSQVIRGSYTFSVDLPRTEMVPTAAGPDPAAPMEGIAPVPVQQGPSDASAPEGGFPYTTSALVGGWLFLASVVGMVGAVVFRLAVPARTGAETAARLKARMPGFGWLVVALAVGAIPTRMIAQARQVAGPGGNNGDAAIQLLDSTWGTGWLLHVVAMVLFAAGMILARRDRSARVPWAVAGVGALFAAVVPALSGHALAAGAPVALLDTVHVLAAGCWLGGLACLLAVGIPAAAHGEADPSDLVSVVRGFSAVALPAVGILVLTGVANALVHLDLADLLLTGYGRILVLKVLTAALAIAVGFYNWRVVRPALDSDPRPALLRIPVAVELAAGLAVLAVTATLVMTARP
jgi:putative copper export protein/methionine-rich copper-binding protein CopC